MLHYILLAKNELPPPCLLSARPVSSICSRSRLSLSRNSVKNCLALKFLVCLKTAIKIRSCTCACIPASGGLVDTSSINCRP